MVVKGHACPDAALLGDVNPLFSSLDRSCGHKVNKRPQSELNQNHSMDQMDELKKNASKGNNTDFSQVVKLSLKYTTSRSQIKSCQMKNKDSLQYYINETRNSQ